jgi:hypothetical protein
MYYRDQDPSARGPTDLREDTETDDLLFFSSMRRHGDARATEPQSKPSLKNMSAALSKANFFENFVSKMFSTTKLGVAMFLYLLADLCYTRYSASSFNLPYVRLLLATGIASFLMFLPKLALHYHSYSMRTPTAPESGPFYLQHIILASLLFFPFLIVPLSDAALRAFVPILLPFLDLEWFISAYPLDKASSTIFILGFSCSLPAQNAICMISFTSLNLQMRTAILAYYLTFVAILLLKLHTVSLPLIIICHIAIFTSAIEWPVLQDRVLSLFAMFNVALSTKDRVREIPCRHRQNASSTILAAFAARFVGRRWNCHSQLQMLLRLSAHFVVVACVLSITHLSFYLFDMHSGAMLVYPLSFFCMAVLHAAPHICLSLFGTIEHQTKCLCNYIRVPYFWSIVSICVILICRFVPLMFNSLLVHAAPFNTLYPQEGILPVLLSAYLPYVFLSFNTATLRPVGWILFNIFTCILSLCWLDTTGNTIEIADCFRITMVNLIGIFSLFEIICSQYIPPALSHHFFPLIPPSPRLCRNERILRVKVR